ncbi:hypothetical protein MUP01_02270 [Candidatus Bathyarchaeota archaeon]|nr:hypothetical protein [Candidatus Bathyarchaeota archaeon]
MGQSRIARAVIEFARMWNAARTVDPDYPPDDVIVFPFILIDEQGKAQSLCLSHVVGAILRLVAEVEAFKEDQRRFGKQVDVRMDETKKED